MIGCTPFQILSRTSATKSYKKLHLNLYAQGTWAPVWLSVQQLHLFRLIHGIKPLKPSATRCHSKSHKSPHVGTWLKSLPPLIMKETYRVIWKQREKEREQKRRWGRLVGGILFKAKPAQYSETHKTWAIAHKSPADKMANCCCLNHAKSFHAKRVYRLSPTIKLNGVERPRSPWNRRVECGAGQG